MKKLDTYELATSGVFEKYDYYGLRTLTDDEDYNIGDIARASYDWDYDNDQSTYETDDPQELDGTAALELPVDSYNNTPEEIEQAIKTALSKSDCYMGSKKVLLGGYYASYGADEGEIDIEDAEVLAILDPQTGKWNIER